MFGASSFSSSFGNVKIILNNSNPRSSSKRLTGSAEKMNDIETIVTMDLSLTTLARASCSQDPMKSEDLEAA